MTETLTLTFDAEHPGIAILTFNRPQVRNALNTEAMIAFAAAVDQLAENDSLRALILTGAGDQAFCSGADIAEMATRNTEADAQDMIVRMGTVLLNLERLPVPVIAAINGFALGGGAEIALACDLRFIDADARMGFVQIRRGLIPGWGGGQRLMRQVGYSRAFDILLNGQTLRAEDLLALGLVNRVISQGSVLDHALDYARQFIQHDAQVVRSLKALLQAGLNQPYEAALLSERADFPSLWVGETRQRSMQQFLERSGQ